MNEKLLRDYMADKNISTHQETDSFSFEARGNLVVVKIASNQAADGVYVSYHLYMLDIIAWVWSQTKQGDK